jgi:uncharacterized membrane protein YuzA (DUF378 family)
MMHKCKGGCGVSKLAGFLLVVGGLNWGLTGIGMLLGMNLNIVNLILGGMPTIEAIIYLVVGIATVVSLMGCKCGKCKESCGSCGVQPAGPSVSV